MVPAQGSVAIVCASRLLLVRGMGPGHARIDYDDSDVDVLLQVNEGIELRDGALVGAGRHWFRYGSGRSHTTPSLQLLDADGAPQLMVTLRDGATTLGREIGDIVLPTDRSLAPLHLRILRRNGTALLENLAGPGRTWLVVRPTERVPANGTLMVGDQVVYLQASRPSDMEQTKPRARIA